ncbi:hypothetical protein [Nevskia sp.]|uniref:hypothetical protein n=1 Tax=Nevskia sp. TaxID=1929292 RepID=UPI0025FB6B60|nr:hypothetical protein [Nevskia sp.]
MQALESAQAARKTTGGWNDPPPLQGERSTVKHGSSAVDARAAACKPESKEATRIPLAMLGKSSLWA